MSRYTIPQEQINCMNLETVSNLLNAMQEEMVELAALEYRLYTRRRELEKIAHPELFIDTEPIKEKKVKKLDKNQLEAIIKAAISRGIDIKGLV